MLGITHTYIRCDKKDCIYLHKYLHKKHGYCEPPKNNDFDEVVRIQNGRCVTYKKK